MAGAPRPPFLARLRRCPPLPPLRGAAAILVTNAGREVDDDREVEREARRIEELRVEGKSGRQGKSRSSGAGGSSSGSNPRRRVAEEEADSTTMPPLPFHAKLDRWSGAQVRRRWAVSSRQGAMDSWEKEHLEPTRSNDISLALPSRRQRISSC